MTIIPFQNILRQTNTVSFLPPSVPVYIFPPFCLNCLLDKFYKKIHRHNRIRIFFRRIASMRRQFDSFKSRRVITHNRPIAAICKQVFLDYRTIRINKPSPPRIIIPAPQIVQPRLLIKHIPTIAERLHLAQRFCQFASTPQRRAPRIVHITNNNISIRIKNCNDSTGKHRRCDTTAAVRIFLKPLRELECSNSLPFLLKRRCLLG